MKRPAVRRFTAVASVAMLSIVAALVPIGPASASHIPNESLSGGPYNIQMQWEHQNFSGRWLVIWGFDGCDGAFEPAEYKHPGFYPSGWDNDIDSFQGSSNCFIKHFEEPNYSTSGAELSWRLTDNDVGGAMHDRSSSLRVS